MGKTWRVDRLLQRLAIFQKLPTTEALLSHQQHKNVSLRDFIGKR